MACSTDLPDFSQPAPRRRPPCDCGAKPGRECSCLQGPVHPVEDTFGCARLEPAAVLERLEAAAQAEQQADKAGAGSKFDAGKPPLGLIPREALLAEAEVLAFGARKYDTHNWRKGMRWSRLSDAALRHIVAFLDGEDTDPETGLPHLAHARTCLGFLIAYQAQGAGTDDRHTAGQA